MIQALKMRRPEVPSLPDSAIRHFTILHSNPSVGQFVEVSCQVETLDSTTYL